jgi:hypothetical protein
MYSVYNTIYAHKVCTVQYSIAIQQKQSQLVKKSRMENGLSLK